MFKSAKNKRGWMWVLYLGCFLGGLQAVYGLVRYFTEVGRLGAINVLGGSGEFVEFVMGEYLNSSLQGAFFFVLFAFIIRRSRKEPVASERDRL